MPKYALTITEEQARVIQQALDLYSRLFMGQLEEVRQHNGIMGNLMVNPSPHCAAEVDVLLERVKEIVFPKLMRNSYHSLRSPEVPDSARIAYDVIQVIRHRVAWDAAGNPPMRGSRMFGVNFDEPYQTSETQPLPTIKTEA